MSKSNPFKWRHYEPEIILLCVRWYLTYPLSYRQVAKMVNERGLDVHHSTIYRWVQQYGPELYKRCRPYLRPTNDSWGSNAIKSHCSLALTEKYWGLGDVARSRRVGEFCIRVVVD